MLSLELGRLTPRETDVLLAAANGETIDKTARKLFISPKTVRNHRTNIIYKLTAVNITHAVSIGFKLGLVDVPLPTALDKSATVW